jgi:hypothetical protein
MDWKEQSQSLILPVLALLLSPVMSTKVSIHFEVKYWLNAFRDHFPSFSLIAHRKYVSSICSISGLKTTPSSEGQFFCTSTRVFHQFCSIQPVLLHSWFKSHVQGLVRCNIPWSVSPNRCWRRHFIKELCGQKDLYPTQFRRTHSASYGPLTGIFLMALCSGRQPINNFRAALFNLASPFRCPEYQCRFAWL